MRYRSIDETWYLLLRRFRTDKTLLVHRCRSGSRPVAPKGMRKVEIQGEEMLAYFYHGYGFPLHHEVIAWDNIKTQYYCPRCNEVASKDIQDLALMNDAHKRQV